MLSTRPRYGTLRRRIWRTIWQDCAGNASERDEDGQLEVDIAGGRIAAHMREHTPEVLTAVARNVQQQLKRHEDEGDNKLVERYQRLQRSLAVLCEKADSH